MDINFPRMLCKYCGDTRQHVELKCNRYGIYCKNCGILIKWAGHDEQIVINARKAWLEEHEKSVH